MKNQRSMNVSKAIFLCILGTLISLTSGTWQVVAQTIVINEFSSSNQAAIADEDGDYPDWIELYNNSGDEINLAGYGLTDDTTQLYKWVFPQSQLPPDGHLVVFASDKNRLSQPLHTNFRIKSDGEPLWLTDPQGRVVDKIAPISLDEDQTYGRVPDGGEAFFVLPEPSPGTPNFLATDEEELDFSLPSGFYQDPVSLSVSGPDSSVLHYTLDGTLPSVDDAFLNGNLQLNNRTGEENVLADIPTGPDWTPPEGEVMKGTVVRVRAFRNGIPVSAVYTHTYFIGLRDFAFPVFSLVTEPGQFFSHESGIYVEGAALEETGYGNYFQNGKDWERLVYLESFGEDGNFLHAQEIGVRIHGRGSRNNPQKSIRFYGRSEYGQSHWENPLFPQLSFDKYKRFILRSPMGDWGQTGFRDALMHSLVRGMDLETQAFRPAILFINGEYWGIQNIRERLDRHYLEAYFDVDEEEVDILEGAGEVSEGENEDFLALMEYVRSHDLADSTHYNQVASQVDIDNFINYHIANFYAMNQDWPSNNYKFWRSGKPGSKWRWFFFDLDGSMFRFADNPLTGFAVEPYTETRLRPEWGTELFRALIKNKSFEQTFMSRFLHHLGTTFAPGRVIAQIDSFARIMDPEMADQIRRWGRPNHKSNWRHLVDDMKTFAAFRPAQLRNTLVNTFGNPLLVYPNPSNGNVEVALLAPSGPTLKVEVFSMEGKQLVSRTGMDSSLPASIQLDHLLPGVYLVKVSDANATYTDKLILRP